MEPHIINKFALRVWTTRITHECDPRVWPTSLTHEKDPREWPAWMNHEFDPRDIHLNHHQLQDALRMAYPPHHCVLQLMMTYYVETSEMGVSILSASCNWWWLTMSKRLKWVYPFSMMGWISHSQCALQLMMTYYVETPEMGVSILIDGVDKPFSVRPASDDDLLCWNAWNGCIHSQWWGG